MEKTINITVKDKIATAARGAMYICGNSDFTAVFSFDSEWDAYDTKTARFKANNGAYTDVIFSGNECAVPIISNANTIQIGVYAGNLSTTTPAFVMAKKSILCGAGAPADPAPDVYNQLMDRLNEIETPSHNELTNRDAADQHPISAITGLEEALEQAASGGGVTSVNEMTGDVTLTADSIGALGGKTVTYWSGGDGTNDLFTILTSYNCGIVSGYGGGTGEPDGMVLPAFVLRGSLDSWNQEFTVIDSEGKSYEGVADLRDNTLTKCELRTDARYAKAEDIQPGHMRINITGNDDDGYTADKTFTEILAHIEAGGSASAFVHDTLDFPFVATSTASGDIIGLTFMIFGEGAFWIIYISSDDTVQNNTLTLTADDFGAIPAPETAEVGQVIAVKAVDSSGKPTEWEVVDMTGGGGGKAWTKLVDYEFDEENTIGTIELTGLDNLTEFYCKGVGLTCPGTSEQGYSLFINNTKLVESSQFLRIGKSGSTVTNWATASYNGIDWHILRSGARTSDYITTTASTTALVPSGVGAATTFKLTITYYPPTGGTLEVWGR